MKRIKLIFFEGCPNAKRIEQLLKKTGISFEAVLQDELPEGHKLRQYSSPTVLLGREVIVGSKLDGTGLGCSLEELTDEVIVEKIEKIVDRRQSYRLALVGGTVSALLASACCLGPLLLAILGTSGASAALFLGNYSFYFSVFAIGLLLFAFFEYKRLAGVENCLEGKCVNTRKRQVRKKLLGGVSVLVLLLLSAPFVLNSFSKQVVASSGSKSDFDTSIRGACEKACASKVSFKESELVPNLVAKPGDLTRCPVSGVVFRVKKEISRSEFQGKVYKTCCPGCAKRFEKDPQRFSKNKV